MSFIDQHAGRRETFKSLAMIGTVVGSWLAIIPCQSRQRDARTRDGAWQRWQLTRPIHSLEYPRLPVDDPKKALALDTFGRANEQIAIVSQGIVEGCAHLSLQLAVEIDQQIAARHEVDVRERRILQQTVLSKNHEIAHLAFDPEVVALAHK